MSKGYKVICCNCGMKINIITSERIEREEFDGISYYYVPEYYCLDCFINN